MQEGKTLRVTFSKQVDRGHFTNGLINTVTLHYSIVFFNIELHVSTDQLTQIVLKLLQIFGNLNPHT